MIKIDSNLRDIVISAFRYALSRKTYIVVQTITFIKVNSRMVDNRMKTVLTNDLHEYLKEMESEPNYKTDIDYKSWLEFYEWLKANC